MLAPRSRSRRSEYSSDLHAGEQHAERDGDGEAPDEAVLVVVQQRMVRPGDRGARGQQDQRVEQRQVQEVEKLDAAPAASRPHLTTPHGNTARWRRCRKKPSK